jgi:hypothetical protein
MKFVANLIGILSMPIYYFVLAWLFSGLFLAFVQLAAFLAVGQSFLVMGLWFVIPVSVTLSLWFGHLTYRFLLRRWCQAANQYLNIYGPPPPRAPSGRCGRQG